MGTGEERGGNAGAPSQNLPASGVLPPASALRILDETADGVLVTNQQLTDHPIVYVNAAFASMTGYSHDETLGRNCRFLQGEDSSQPEIAVMREAIAAGRAITATLRNYRRDRSMFYNEVRIAPLDMGTDGTPAYYVGFQRDVTERVEAETKLRHALAAAEEANRAKSGFLAMMSHEIRTPMNAVLGLAGSLLDGSLPPEQHQMARAIHESGDILLRLLNDILDFAKLEAGQMTFEDAPFSPGVMTHGTTSILGPQAAGKGLILNADCDPALPSALVGDAGRIRQILLNLVSNAVKFTETGSVTIRAECLARDAASATIRWVVSDSGIGIPADRIVSLFREFVQVDNSVTRRFGGTGLGLAITKRLVNQMGGIVTVETALGQGTTFRVDLTLPISERLLGTAPKHADPAPAVDALLRARRARLRILVAEDNPTNQFVARQLLRNLDIQVDVAGNGREAVEAVKRFAYDLIFMDMRMPEMDGLKAARAIRQLGGRLESIPIIALTASAFADDVKACREAGMNQFLPKPVSKDMLLSVIYAVLSGGAWSGFS